MSKVYLHKKDKEFTTNKKTIIADLDKIKNRSYKYKRSVFDINPKELVIIGKKSNIWNIFQFNLFDFPVNKVIVNNNIHSHHSLLHNFNNAKELEFSDNVKKVEIYNSLGLKKLENLIIPFTIDDFTNEFMIDSKLRYITVKYEKEEQIIEIDDIFNESNIGVFGSKINNILKLCIKSDATNICYQFYIKDGKLEYNKEIISYGVKPNDDSELNLLELRKKYNCKLLPYRKYTNDKVILTKDDYKFFDYIDRDKLKEIIIKDENDMSLFPRDINIKKESNSFKDIETLDDKLLISIEKEDKTNKYVLINDDLSYIELDSLNNINKIYLDFDTNKFCLTKMDGNNILTLPLNKQYDYRKYKIITELMNSVKDVRVKNKDIEKRVFKLFPSYDEVVSLKRYDENNFILYYTIFNNNIELKYTYDTKNNDFNITFLDNRYDYYNSEVSKAKKLLYKKIK